LPRLIGIILALYIIVYTFIKMLEDEKPLWKITNV